MAIREVRYRAAAGPYLLISGHDYRSKRKANVHFIMRELAKRDKARFFSAGFSALSLSKRDPRASLWQRANSIERYEGIDCYLWRSVVHPVNLRHSWFSPLERVEFEAYARRVPGILREWIGDSKTVILESGLPIIFFDLIKHVNPHAAVIYLCSDALDTIGCATYLSQHLQRISPSFDGIRVPSRRLTSEFPRGCSIYFVPHGMDAVLETPTASPYAGGTNLVSVGNMLFDRGFFEIATRAFPEYNFHVIGGGKKARGLEAPNLRVYGEMSYAETLPFISHADVGIAPYDGEKVSPYLLDTSMKLMQYEGFGLPAVCPMAAAGSKPGRFGYIPGDGESIAAAVKAALARGRLPRQQPLAWSEVTDRILAPQNFSDTAVDERQR